MLRTIHFIAFFKKTPLVIIVNEFVAVLCINKNTENLSCYFTICIFELLRPMEE